MLIAIKFGDNDYKRTFEAVLQSFLHSWESWRGPERFDNLTEEKITEIVNHLSYGMYLLHQHTGRREDNGRVEEWLKIDLKDVYIGDDALELIGHKEWHNGEVFVLDTNLSGYENNEPVYAV